MDTFELEKVDVKEDIAELKNLIERHLDYTGSEIAKTILSDWKKQLKLFTKVMPTDYKRVLAEMDQKRKEAV
jgi:glutamate synthase domain-containing protein 3